MKRSNVFWPISNVFAYDRKIANEVVQAYSEAVSTSKANKFKISNHRMIENIEYLERYLQAQTLSLLYPDSK